MKIEPQTNNDTLIVHLSGKGAEDDHNNISSILEEYITNSIKTIEINLEELRLVQSSTLGILLVIHHYIRQIKESSINLCITGAKDQAKITFKHSNFHKIFDIS